MSNKLNKKKILAHAISVILIALLCTTIFILITSPLVLVFLVDDEFSIKEYLIGITEVTFYAGLFSLLVILPIVLVSDLIGKKHKKLSILLLPVFFFLSCFIYFIYLLLNLESNKIGPVVDVVFKPIILLPITAFLSNIYWVVYRIANRLIKLVSRIFK